MVLFDVVEAVVPVFVLPPHASKAAAISKMPKKGMKRFKLFLLVSKIDA